MLKRSNEDVTEMSGWLYADLLLGLAVVFLVAVPFIGISESSATNCPTVVIPDVSGKAIEDAAIEIEKRTLVVKKIPLEKQGIPEDEVYLQEPNPGQSVCEGAQVRLTYNLRQDPAPEVYPETFKIVLKTADAKQLGVRLQAWIQGEGIRDDSFVNVALVYGYYSGDSSFEGTNNARDAYRNIVEGCVGFVSCQDLGPIVDKKSKSARFIGTRGDPTTDGLYQVGRGEFFVEMFVVCPDKCKG
jgi:hypothetical protein